MYIGLSFFRGGDCLSTAVEDIQELFVCVRKHTNAGGGSGGMVPQENFAN